MSKQEQKLEQQVKELKALLEWALDDMTYLYGERSQDSEYDFCSSCQQPEWDHKKDCEGVAWEAKAIAALKQGS